jgi:hypothetical protein
MGWIIPVIPSVVVFAGVVVKLCTHGGADMSQAQLLQCY